MTLSKIFIKPALGQNLTDEKGNLIPIDGIEVENSIYWQRRINDGDAVTQKTKTQKGEN